MNKTLSTLLLTLLLTSAPTTSWAFKCWVNSEGIRECGNAIPPEYAQQESGTYSERGVMQESTKRALNKEEIDEIRLNKQQALEREALEEERRAKQEREDHLLRMTFTSKDDIIASLERKLSSLDATTAINQIIITKLEKKVQGNKERIQRLKKINRPPPDGLAEETLSIERQIVEKTRYLSGIEKDKLQLKNQYDSFLKRYGQLMEMDRAPR